MVLIIAINARTASNIDLKVELSAYWCLLRHKLQIEQETTLGSSLACARETIPHPNLDRTITTSLVI
ncbi:hypothetical protein KC19_1G291700 [Ceratodon purpureus]|uniref:Uncharacterized protein n=1 Tax=Ceratodon purpureus TaxID=3225 RepID=A0A8T0JBU4_CERPU|nr:hypothetical protein KC19_1G291700 [Ceratodon purpureus]